MSKAIAGFVFFVLVFAACTSQKQVMHIADTGRYLFDTVHTDADDEAMLEFFSYSTYFHIVSDSDFTERQNRPGVLLSAKNTAYLNWNGEAAFGSPGDTCWISYRSHNEKVMVGRSAAISVFNFFNNEALNNKPEEYFLSKELNGSVRLHQTAAPFHLHQRKTEAWKSRGWMVMNRDSFFLQPAVKTAQEKESRNLFVVKQGSEEPVAAIDFYQRPRLVYLRKDLTPAEQSILSAYLFILLCYLR